MTRYIALLRGINVGGKNIIKMEDLKRTFEALDLSKVKTYIQSGNVLFESDEKKEPLRKRIEHEIEAVYGFGIAVVLRSATELKSILRNCPFSEKELSHAAKTCEGESFYVALLTTAPSEEGLKRLNTYKNDKEDYRVIGLEVFLLFHEGIRNSKLAAQLQKLDKTSTIRNWKTINKLVALLTSTEID